MYIYFYKHNINSYEFPTSCVSFSEVQCFIYYVLIELHKYLFLKFNFDSWSANINFLSNFILCCSVVVTSSRLESFLQRMCNWSWLKIICQFSTGICFRHSLLCKVINSSVHGKQDMQYKTKVASSLIRLYGFIVTSGRNTPIITLNNY